MNRKKPTLLLFFIIIFTFTLLTCNLFYRPMNLVLPAALYADDTSLNEGEGVIEIYDYEDEDLIIELEIVPADEDNVNNNNDDSDDLSKILSVPGFVTIPENKLSITFTCEAFDTDMGTAELKDVTVKATALHYNEAEDTIAIYNTVP